MWNTNSNYNKFKNSYFQSYVDISGGGIILRNGSDMYFETGTSTLSGLIISSNNYIRTYYASKDIKDKLYTTLLTISSNVSYIVSTISITNSIKQNIYQTKYYNTVSSYIIYIPTHTYTANYDASGNFSTVNIIPSGYNTGTNFITLSSYIFTLSGLAFFNNLSSTMQSQYSNALSNYNIALTTNNTDYNNMMTLSNTIYNNKVYQYIPLYTSLNTILNNNQNLLNTISANIKVSNNNLQSQINAINSNTFQTQINSLSYYGNTYQNQLNSISSVVIISNNNLQSQINAINSNTFQTQINSLSYYGNTYQNQLNTISSNVKLMGTQINYQPQIDTLTYYGNTYQNQLNTLSGVVKIIQAGSLGSSYVDLTTTQNITGLKTFSSNIGIGTTGPNGRLHVVLNGAYSSGSGWDVNVAVFGESGSQGKAVGISFNTTTNTGYIDCIAPYIAWYPLKITCAGLTYNGVSGQPFTVSTSMTCAGNCSVGSLTSGGRVIQNLANSNTQFGNNTLNSLTGSINTAFGNNVMNNISTGIWNTGVGVNTLGATNTGNYNSGYGVNALPANNSGGSNNAFGVNALYSNNTGSNNNSIGRDAMYSNTTGSDNNAIGRSALFSNSLGNNLLAMGTDSMYYTTDGIHCIGIGYRALYSNTSSNYNVAVGPQALYDNTTGGWNTGIGLNAGKGVNQTTQINNTYIGAQTSSGGNFSNSTAIGYGATITANNQIQLGASSEKVNCQNLNVVQAIYYPGMACAYMYNFTSAGSPLPIMCSIKDYSLHLINDCDDAYLLLPGYNLVVYPDINYGGTAITFFTNGTASIPLYSAVTYANSGGSCKLYNKDNVEITIAGISY